ncbi:hypothetical protein HYW20_06345 [Candidatus Woesearchaeota archaeon]|nr:hypothetical protein [Candidatus Woesearchaeota archaeon]
MVDYQSRLKGIDEALFFSPFFAERGNELYVDAVKCTKTLKRIIKSEEGNKRDKSQLRLFPNSLGIINKRIEDYGEPKTSRIEDLIAEIEHRTYFAGKGHVVLKEELGKGKYVAYPHNLDQKRAIPILFCLDTLLDGFIEKKSDSYMEVRNFIDTTVEYVQRRGELKPFQDQRATKPKTDVLRSGQNLLDKYKTLMERAMKNQYDFEKYVLTIALISTYDSLTHDLGKDSVEKSVGTIEEKKQIDTKEKINRFPKYWHNNYYAMRWRTNKGQMWNLVRQNPLVTIPNSQQLQNG